MMNETMRQNRKVLYYRKPKMKISTTNRQDPLSKQLKHKMLLQVNYLSENFSAFNTHYGSFTIGKKDRMDSTSTSFMKVSQFAKNNTKDVGKKSSLQKGWMKNGPVYHPKSVNNVRQLLKRRNKISNEQNIQLSSNPFYKIQKKRPRSLVIIKTEPHEQSINSRLDINRFVTEAEENPDKYPLNDIEQHQILKTKQIFYPPKSIDDDNTQIRDKSQTRVYQQIKKYFEQKYGQIRKKSQQVPPMT